MKLLKVDIDRMAKSMLDRLLCTAGLVAISGYDPRLPASLSLGDRAKRSLPPTINLASTF